MFYDKQTIRVQPMDFSTVRNKLQEAGVVCEDGLAEGEIQLVEHSFGFKFPPDLRAFLMCGSNNPRAKISGLDDRQRVLTNTWTNLTNVIN